MNPKKSFDMQHTWLPSPGTLFVPTLLVTCTTVRPCILFVYCFYLLTYLLKYFSFRARTNDVRVLFESVPNMLLIGKSCITISATGSCNDPDLGNCKQVEEQRKFVHPRLSLFRLSHREIRKANFSEKEPVVDENIVPVPILNRFKNSTFWSTPTAPLEAEQYYSRKLTLDPNYRKRYSYEHTFDKSRDCQSTQSGRRLKEFSNKNQTLSNQVDTLEKNLKSKEKDLESKDEEIKMLRARLERKEDS